MAEARPTPAPSTPKKPINKAPEIDKLIKKHRESGNKLNIPVLIAAIAGAIFLLAGIIWAIANGNKDYYSDYENEGYTVKVTFDSNGGTFKGSDSSVIDLFKADDIGEDGIKLLAPDDARRDKNNALTVTKAGYFLAGWYREMTAIDPANPDAGYSYSGKWDFESDRLTENELTLYAAWVPYYTYEIYDSETNTLVATTSAINLTIPKWNSGDVTLDMDNFPVREGYTLIPDEVDYSASDIIVNEINGKTTITGKWDEDSATSLTPTIKIYTKWQEGERYRIYSTEDLRKNASVSGYYEIYADLDFAGLEWPSVFANDKFEGKIFGRNHTISNVTVESTSRSRINNGLFSSLGENAYIENLSFENITHKINLMSVAPGASFGLLTGTVAEGAEFNNVSISGKILIGDDCAAIAGNNDYTIGLIAGVGEISGIESDVSVEKANPGNNTFGIEIDGNTVSLTKSN